MVQIIPSNQRRSFGEQMLSGLTEAVPGIQNFLQQQNRQKAQSQFVEKMGIDPSIFSLPEKAQSEFFKNVFAREKPLTALQQSQKNLSDERLKSLQQEQDYFNQLLGGKSERNEFGENNRNVPEEVNESIPQSSGFRGISDSKLEQLAGFKGQPGKKGILGNQAQAELDRREKEQKHGFEMQKMTRQEETELSKPVLLELNQARKNIPLQEQAIEDIIEASPNISALDYFADITGFEPLRSAEGAKLKTGIKDFFLSDLTRVGTRPNQWIEQQLADALPKIGRSPEANLITAEGLKFKVDLAKKRIDLVDKLAEQDRKKFGYVKGDVDSRAYNDMKKYVAERQKELHDKIKKIKAINKGNNETVRMVSPDGSVYEIDVKDIDEALEHEFSFQQNS